MSQDRDDSDDARDGWMRALGHHEGVLNHFSHITLNPPKTDPHTK